MMMHTTCTALYCSICCSISGGHVVFTAFSHLRLCWLYVCLK